MDSEEPTTSDIRWYGIRNSDSGADNAAVHSNVSNAIPAGDVNSSNTPSTSNSLDPCAFNTVENQQNEQTRAISEEMWTLCDLEKQHLREMFPTCPENVLTEASETCVTVDSAVDHVMNSLSDQAST